MFGLKHGRRAALVAGGGVLALAVTGGIAYAAIPNSHNGIIAGCYKVNGGALRVIDAQNGRSCTGGEASLKWNQQGATGPQGPQGAQGPQGPATPLAPHEETRVLTMGDNSSGVFGGLQCGSGTLISGGFSILRSDVEIRESYIGPAFGVSRVYVVRVGTPAGNGVGAGDAVKMFVTCA